MDTEKIRELTDEIKELLETGLLLFQSIPDVSQTSSRYDAFCKFDAAKCRCDYLLTLLAEKPPTMPIGAKTPAEPAVDKPKCGKEFGIEEAAMIWFTTKIDAAKLTDCTGQKETDHSLLQRLKFHKGACGTYFDEALDLIDRLIAKNENQQQFCIETKKQYEQLQADLAAANEKIEKRDKIYFAMKKYLHPDMYDVAMEEVVKILGSDFVDMEKKDE